MASDLKLETRTGESPLPSLAMGENILGQEPQDVKVSENHQEKLPTQKQHEESHQ
jgi:hypothetical protein